MRIDRETTKEIRGKIADFIGSLESEYGIKLDRQSARYSEADIKFTFSVSLKEDKRDNGVLTSAEERYDLEAPINGLPPRGTEFTSGSGDTYTIKEWLPRGRKYKVLAIRNSDGGRFKFSIQNIRLYTLK